MGLEGYGIGGFKKPLSNSDFVKIELKVIGEFLRKNNNWFVFGKRFWTEEQGCRVLVWRKPNFEHLDWNEFKNQF